MLPRSGRRMISPEQLQSRAQAYIQSIPGQTLGLLCTCVGVAIFDFISMDLATQALTLERAPVIVQAHQEAVTKSQRQDFTMSTILLVLSCFSAIHGFFSILLSIYFGKDVLAETERADQTTQWVFLVHLGLRQVAINLMALSVDYAWFMTFPNAWARLAKFGGFGGLFPLICCLEAEKAFFEADSQVEMSLLPFTVTRRYKPFVYAFFFSILGCGDVDLFCGAILGFVFVYVHSISGKIRNALRFRTPFAGSNSTTEETTTLLPVHGHQLGAQDGTSGSSGKHAQDAIHSSSDADKRAILLAAANKRLSEKQGETNTNSTNTNSANTAADML